MYSVDLSAKAQKFYAKADQTVARKLAHSFEQLEKDPRQHPNIKRLTGGLAGLYRFRTGDYRVIYRIDDEEKSVVVLKIAHRSEVYR